MNNIQYPFFVKDKNFKEPNLPFYYLLSSDGLFLVKNFSTYRAVIKMEKGLPWLENHTEELNIKIPKISSHTMEKVAGFFYVVFRLYQSEAIALLYYSQKKQSFKIVIPKQQIEVRTIANSTYSVYGLDYTLESTPVHYIRVGTIHSHADLPAFYSYTDEHDSRFDDSLNIVIGNVNRKKPTFSACFIVNGRKFDMNPPDIIEGFKQPLLPVPRNWINQISFK